MMGLGLSVQRTGLAPPEIVRQGSDLDAAAGVAVEETTTRVKERGRALLRLGFPNSRRVPTILRGDFFPRKAEKPPTGYVYSAWFKRGRDILFGFATGRPITAPGGKRMLVPADNSPGGKAMARAALEALGRGPRIGLVKTKAGKLLLVERRATETRILGFLVRTVRPPKRFDASGLEPYGDRVLAERLAVALRAKGF